MANARNLSTLAQGASTAGILAGTYGGTGASLSPTTAGNTIFTTDGTNWSSTQKIVRGTTVASTSGTSIDFNSIPSWVKRITVMLSGVSTTGTSGVMVQIGAGSIQTTGYVIVGGLTGTTGSGGGTATTGFNVDVGGPTAASVRYGTCVMTLLDAATGLWVATCLTGHQITTNYYGMLLGGSKALSGTLDRVRLTTVTGTDTFDAGSVNILYE
jgi:hypothetical protein